MPDWNIFHCTTEERTSGLWGNTAAAVYCELANENRERARHNSTRWRVAFVCLGDQELSNLAGVGSILWYTQKRAIWGA